MLVIKPKYKKKFLDSFGIGLSYSYFASYQLSQIADETSSPTNKGCSNGFSIKSLTISNAVSADSAGPS